MKLRIMKMPRGLARGGRISAMYVFRSPIDRTKKKRGMINAATGIATDSSSARVTTPLPANRIFASAYAAAASTKTLMSVTAVATNRVLIVHRKKG